MAATSRLYRWSLTKSAEGTSKDDIEAWLRINAKRWAFQREKGTETGYDHFQIAMSLNEKVTKRQLDAMLNTSVYMRAARSSPTHCEDGADGYVMKEDTRIDGPWAHSDQPEAIDMKGWVPRPWQASIIEKLKPIELRTINVLIDPEGCKGKSQLTRYLRKLKLGMVVGVVADAKVMSGMIASSPIQHAYFFDISRGTQLGKKEAELWNGIEQLKGGFAYDTRYKYKEVHLSRPPNIWIFMNEMPPLHRLSHDRWSLWLINQSLELIEYTPKRLSALEGIARANKLAREMREKVEKKIAWDPLDDVESSGGGDVGVGEGAPGVPAVGRGLPHGVSQLVRDLQGMGELAGRFAPRPTAHVLSTNENGSFVAV